MLCIPGGASTERVDRWVSQGLMTPEQVLQRMRKKEGTYQNFMIESPSYYNEGIAEIKTEDVAAETEHGSRSNTSSNTTTTPLHEENIISILQRHNAIPGSLQDAAPIIFHALHLLSRYPFQPALDKSHGLLEDDIRQGLYWLVPVEKKYLFVQDHESGLAYTPIQIRRVIFQALATGRDGLDIQLDTDDWRREARRRAFEGVESRDCDKKYRLNYDEWGDEIYHDMVEALYVAQPEHHPGIAGQHRDAFRPLAARYHQDGGGTRLCEYTLSPERLRPVLRLSLYHIFGIGDSGSDAGHFLEPADLDETVECFLRAFVRDSKVGINWPMFDNVFQSAPYLLLGLFHVLCLIEDRVNRPEQSLLKSLYKQGKIFTAPVLAQFQSVLKHDREIWFDDFDFPWHHDPKSGFVNATELLGRIREVGDDLVIVLVSGRDIKTSERYLVGILIPEVVKSEKRIQPPDPRIEEARTACLLEFSPVHTLYQGDPGCPAWTMIGEDIAFGDPQNGVALLLKNGLGSASFVHTLDGPDDPIYKPPASASHTTSSSMSWRGNLHVDLALDGIEICRDYRTNFSESDEIDSDADIDGELNGELDG